jgi:hypothetical protein
VTAPADQDFNLAALVAASAKGKRLTAPEQDALRRGLMRMKSAGNVSWTVIGSVYGLTGPEMRRVRKIFAAKPGQP